MFSFRASTTLVWIKTGTCVAQNNLLEERERGRGRERERRERERAWRQRRNIHSTHRFSKLDIAVCDWVRIFVTQFAWKKWWSARHILVVQHVVCMFLLTIMAASCWLCMKAYTSQMNLVNISTAFWALASAVIGMPFWNMFRKQFWLFLCLCDYWSALNLHWSICSVSPWDFVSSPLALAPRFHRIARLWTSNDDQDVAMAAQRVVEASGRFQQTLIPRLDLMWELVMLVAIILISRSFVFTWVSWNQSYGAKSWVGNNNHTLPVMEMCKKLFGNDHNLDLTLMACAGSGLDQTGQHRLGEGPVLSALRSYLTWYCKRTLLFVFWRPAPVGPNPLLRQTKPVLEEKTTALKVHHVVLL